MNFDINDVKKGIGKGLARAKQHFLNVPTTTNEIEVKISGALNDWSRDLSNRFVELFAELTTLAEITRWVNEEPLLSEDELIAFLGNAALFFNSFKHR